MIYQKFKWLITLLFVCNGVAFSQSQYGAFQYLGTEQGMFHNNVKCLFEDSKGFIWIGTSDGLMRYDSNTFDLFRRSKKNHNSLSNNYINAIVEDENQYAFWIGTGMGGLNYFDPIQEKYENYPLAIDSTSDIPYVSILSLAMLSDSTLLVGTETQGLYIFHRNSGLFSPVPYSFNTSKTIRKIKKRGETFYCSIKGCIIKVDDKGSIKSYINLKGKIPDENIGGILDFEFLTEDTLLLGMNNALYKLNTRDLSVNLVTELKDVVNIKAISLDGDSSVWLGTVNKGVYYYSLHNNKVINHYSGEGNDAVNTSYDHVSCIIRNRNQPIVWLGTNKGISIYRYQALKFVTNDFRKLAPQSLGRAYFLAKDTYGTYWFHDWINLYYREKGDSKFERFIFEEGRGVYVYKMFEEGGNNYFVTSKGLIRYNTKTKEQQKIPLFDDVDNPDRVVASAKKDSSNVWLLTEVGLINLDLKRLTTTYYPLPRGKEKVTFASMKMSNDRSKVWFTIDNGKVFSFDVQSKKYTYYNLKELADQYLQHFMILDFEFDQFDKLWLATYGGGLLCFDPNTQTLSDTLAISSIENYAYSILRDDNDILWVGSNFGLSKINPESLEMIEYHKSDGTFCEEFNNNSCYKCSDGKFLFGGINGFIEFDPLHMDFNNYNAPVYISALGKENKVLKYNEEFYDDVFYMDEPDSISIPKGINSFKLYASMLDYLQPDYNKIKWRLNGYDEDWNFGYPSDAIAYNNLPQGNYMLEVVGINKDGYESNRVAKTNIVIKAPFIQTVYFKILVLCIVIVLIYLFFRLRISWYKRHERILTKTVNKKTFELTQANKRLATSKEEISKQKAELEKNKYHLELIVQERTEDLKKAKDKAEKSDQLKTSFLANLSHEIRTPMNAIIGFSTLLKSKGYSDEEKEEFVNVINQSGESLLVLIDDMIDVSRIETGNVSIVNSTFLLVELVDETIEELFFEEKSDLVEFKKHYDSEIIDKSIYSDRFRLKQVISNLLRNAYKFTKEGYIFLKLSSVNSDQLAEIGFDIVTGNPFNAFLFEIEDTGIGISSDAMNVIFEPFRKAFTKQHKHYQGLGLGLSIVKNLLLLLNGDILVASVENQGTKFVFYIQY